MNIRGFEALRVTLRHLLIHRLDQFIDVLAIPLMQAAEIGEREDASDLLDLVLLQRVPDAIAHKQEDRLGVVDDMMYVVRIEILQDRDDDRTIGDDRHVGDTPASVILVDQGYFITAS